MTRAKKFLSIAGASAGGVVVIAAIASYAVIQSTWFSNYVKDKIVSVAETSTGGKVEMGRFDIDLSHLTIKIYDFVLHGTEPRKEAPLLRAHLVELHLRLFSGIAHLLDLSYLGVERPQANLLTYADGTTNIPEPRKPSTSSGGNPLKTVVDLKIGQFNLYQGLLQYNEQQTVFQAHGENLRVLLNYNSAKPGYDGNLAFDPLTLKSGNRPPLVWHVNVPISIESSALRISNATLSTNLSKVILTASLEGANQKVINAKLNASVQLPELARSLELPIYPESPGAPNLLTAEVAAHIDQNTETYQIDVAHLAVGATTFQLAGTARHGKNARVAAAFNGSLALGQLEPLLGIASPKAAGYLDVNGYARLDENNNYHIDGTINSKSLSLSQGATRLADLRLYTPFHADPYLISMDGLQLGALGGTLSAKIFIEKLTQLSVEGKVHNFSIPLLASVATGKHLGYDGLISGDLRADGNLKAKGTSGYTAGTRLVVTPGREGVPVSGHVNVSYSGARDLLTITNSDLTLPHSKLGINGALNKDLKINLVSRDLNDFLPAVNFGSKQPEKRLPMALQGGQAVIQADVIGSLSNPQITAHAELQRFALEQHPFDLAALDLSANPSSARIQSGILSSGQMKATFDLEMGLRKWTPLPSSQVEANVSLQHGTVTQLLGIAGQNMPVTGEASGDIHIRGTYGNPLGSAVVQVQNGIAYDQPFEHFSANVNLADRLITIRQLEIASTAGTVEATGTYQHPKDSFLSGAAAVNVSTSSPVDLSKIVILQRRSPGSAGIVRLDASARIRLDKAGSGESIEVEDVSGNVTARGLKVENETAGDLTLTAQTQNRTVSYRLSSNFAGSSINANGTTRLVAEYPTNASFSIRDLGVSKVLRIAGESSLPVRGTLTAEGHVNGTIKSPNGDMDFSFVRGLVYQEPVNRLAGSVSYRDTILDIPSLTLDVPAGSVRVKGSFRHPAGVMSAGDLNLDVTSNDVDLAKIQHVHAAQPTLTGTARVTLDVAAKATSQRGKPAVLVSNLNAAINTSELQLQHRDLGKAELVAQTSGTTVNYHVDSNFARSQLHLTGNSQLTGDYPTRASLTFSNVKYSNLAPFLSAEPSARPTFDAIVQGSASVDGPVLDAKALQGQLTLSRLALTNNSSPTPTGGPPTSQITIQNEGPVQVAYRNEVLDVQQFKLRGPSTKIDVGGTIDLKDQNSPMNVQASATLDLSILEKISSSYFSSGTVTLDAALHGSFAQPLVNGKLELQNANVNAINFSNGLSNGHGTILLTGTGAIIQNLTGQSGGGTVNITGFAGWTGLAFTYNVKANANHVRFRQSGISATANATVTVIGNTNRSLVNGDVLVQRIAYGSSGDAGSILSSFSSTPPSVPLAPSPFLTGMRLNIHVLTSPDLRVVTTYANKLNIQANLTVRGTAASPGILGRVTVTEGQLEFFGNTYTVNTGTVNFYSATTIEPVVNFSLQTLAQGVNVTLGVSGPVNNLQLTYRSDPPLTFQQIVQLLATNTTPSDPNIAANQPLAPQQSFTQMGESAVLGQAIANPLASRVQRVFGLSEFKIDPNVAGNNGQPSARVTLQQKISNNLIFTYITDVTQSNSEIIRIQWDLTPTLSVIGLRDFNGYVSIEMFYKWKKR